MARSGSVAAAAAAHMGEAMEAMKAMGEAECDFPDVHSPTDSSEDSVEVRVRAISFSAAGARGSGVATRGKRKRTEPRRFPEASAALLATAPLKKRVCLQERVAQEAAHAAQAQRPPFRPWSPPPPPPTILSTPLCHGYGAYFRPPSPRPPHDDDDDEQPVALVKRSEASPEPSRVPAHTPASVLISTEPDRLPKRTVAVFEPSTTTSRVPVHPQAAALTPAETDRLLLGAAECFPALRRSPHDSVTVAAGSTTSRREQRNYKNMTRERRIEANARERTRVHTISAAFETLRRSVPAYSHNQKLSKLSVLRIACSYIKTLAGIAGRRDDGHDDADVDAALADSVDAVSRTIQREGKLRKKKDDDD